MALSPLKRPRAVIFGCAGLELTPSEDRFFQTVNPVGFILFKRNCQTPDQVRQLVAALRASVRRPDAPVLIDQEGGRVQRLGPPQWPALPAGAVFAECAARHGMETATSAARLHGRLLAADLAPLGITVNCAPVLDVLRPETHDVIGDRAFGETPEMVARLGRAVGEGLLDGGVLPVIKHIPGHGRASVDSHKELPEIDAATAELAASDFVPFQALSDLPWAMTAHVVYRSIDAQAPASTSRKVIRKIVRGVIGFGGLLISDDIGMQALSGSMEERARACLATGCDIVLHCSGDLAEMQEVNEGLKPLRQIAESWLEKSDALRLARQLTGPVDVAALCAERDQLLAGATS